MLKVFLMTVDLCDHDSKLERDINFMVLHLKWGMVFDYLAVDGQPFAIHF